MNFGQKKADRKGGKEEGEEASLSGLVFCQPYLLSSTSSCLCFPPTHHVVLCLFLYGGSLDLGTTEWHLGRIILSRGPSRALQEVEQPPWPLPTRCP